MRLREFKVQLSLRLTGMFISMLILAFGIAGDFSTSLLICLVIIIAAQFLSLVRFVNQTNHELESFLGGLKFGDFQQTYTIGHLGSSFQLLEQSLHDTVQKFKSMRNEKEKQGLYNQALIQHIPLPLFIVHPDGRVEVLNNQTRRTFNVADITNTGELANFGASFQRDVLQIQPGEALLTSIEFSGIQEHFVLTATQLTSAGETHKLISLQNVQSQIDATELATWQNLLRVTSHEILNSLAPVSSSAQSAKMLVDEAINNDFQGDKFIEEGFIEDMRDIQESLDTVLRRSEGLTRFIKSYRQLSRMPRPDKTKIEFSHYFQQLQSLVKDELAQKEIQLDCLHPPKGLSVMADKDMLDQMSINLIRNASEALIATRSAKITISAYIDGQHRTVLEVRDNGPGIPHDQVDKIFMPFFTTKKQGSGIGLALVRYIMLSHGGTAMYETNGDSGSSFRLVF